MEGNGERILIIDDEPAIARLCSRVLKRHGYNTVAPAFGDAAIDLALQGEYDLLLCDIRMPDLNGLDLFRRLRRTNQDVVAVMITGHATVESVIEALNEGVEGFIQKPFRSEELVGAVARAFQKSRQNRESLRLQALMPLLELNNLLIDDIETGSLFGSVLTIVREKLKAERVSCLLEDENKEDTLSIVASHGLAREFMAPKNVRTDNGVIGHVFRTGKPMLVADSLTDPVLRTSRRTDGIRSGLCVPIQISGRTIGCICASRLENPEPFSEVDLDVLMIIGNQVATHLENLRLYRALHSSYMKTIDALTGAIEAKDAYTKGHSHHVAVYAARIGRHLGLEQQDIENLHIAGMLHDVGKIGIPEELLVKPGALTHHEREIMKTHPFYGLKILEPVGLPQPVLCAIHHHHERFDGKGYPEGLVGDEIPVYARILQVADAIDAMSSNRPYRKMYPWQQVEGELRSHSETQFDPEIVRAALTLRKKGLLFSPGHPFWHEPGESPDRLDPAASEASDLSGFPNRRLPLATP